MLPKLIAIVLSVLINCGVLACFHAWSTSSVAVISPSARADDLPTLPAIVVHPTRAQLESLRREAAPASTAGAASTGGGHVQAFVMPYYSFGDASGARNG